MMHAAFKAALACMMVLEWRWCTTQKQ